MRLVLICKVHFLHCKTWQIKDVLSTHKGFVYTGKYFLKYTFKSYAIHHYPSIEYIFCSYSPFSYCLDYLTQICNLPPQRTHVLLASFGFIAHWFSSLYLFVTLRWSTDAVFLTPSTAFKLQMFCIAYSFILVIVKVQRC